MSVTNVVCQRRHRCLHLLTDGASYSRDGVLLSIGNKAFTVPHWPGAMSSRGSAIGGALIEWSLSNRFQSFDELVDGVETEVPLIVRRFELTDHVELILAGWSAARGAPEAYVIETSDSLPANLTQAERDAGSANGSSGEMFSPDAFALTRLPDVVMGPILSDDMVIAAHWTGVDVDGSPEAAISELRKIIEMQRHDIRGDGMCWVGGFAQLTTITPGGISQRILHRWTKDVIGEPIKPEPIDWKAYNAARAVESIPEGLSRLQRERKKALS